jgi:hypothetical protein
MRLRWELLFLGEILNSDSNFKQRQQKLCAHRLAVRQNKLWVNNNKNKSLKSLK